MARTVLHYTQRIWQTTTSTPSNLKQPKTNPKRPHAVMINSWAHRATLSNQEHARAAQRIPEQPGGQSSPSFSLFWTTDYPVHCHCSVFDLMTDLYRQSFVSLENYAANIASSLKSHTDFKFMWLLQELSQDHKNFQAKSAVQDLFGSFFQKLKKF